MFQVEAHGVYLKKVNNWPMSVFSSDKFKWHCEELCQRLILSGVGAKFQNGVAKQAIG